MYCNIKSTIATIRQIIPKTAKSCVANTIPATARINLIDISLGLQIPTNPQLLRACKERDQTMESGPLLAQS